MKKKKDYEFYLTRFQEVVCFLTAVGIKKHFNTVAEYKKAPNSSKAYCLNISGKILLKLSRVRSIDKYRFEEFIEASSSLFTYHRHCYKKYKSKKKFSRNSWFELSDHELEKWFSDDSSLNTKTCELINKESHKWIDKHIYYKIQQKEGTMTKAEEKAIYDKAANGELGCAPEYVIKQIKKKERSQKRRQKTMVKNALESASEDFIKLKVENEQLKAKVARLEQLKDLNSDIPSESLESSELEKLRADAAMWRKIDFDPLACEQHYNEVLSRMQPAEDREDIVVDQAMQAQLDQIRLLQSKQSYNYDYDKITDEWCKAASAPDFVRDGSDIPDMPPEPVYVQPPADDIPSEAEQKEDKASLLSFMLQGLVNCRILQKSEANTLRDNSIWKSEIPSIVDKLNVTLDDTQKHIRERYRIAKYIQQHMREFSLESWNENKYPKRWAESIFRDFGHMKK